MDKGDRWKLLGIGICAALFSGALAHLGYLDVVAAKAEKAEGLRTEFIVKSCAASKMWPGPEVLRSRQGSAVIVWDIARYRKLNNCKAT